MHLPRMVKWSVYLVFFALGLSFLGLRYVVAPQITEQRERIEQAISQQLGLKVELAALQANWNGLRPELSIRNFRVFDHENRLALELPQVEVSVGWSSLWHRQLRFHRLEIVRPELALRREMDGRIFIAGLLINAAGASEDASFGDFVLAQNQVVIRDARLVWTDALRAAPPLALDRVNVRLENSGDSHRFAILASPPEGYSANLDVRGDLYGEGFKSLDDWRGQLYLSLDKANLAVWQQWLDYPLALPRGRGGLRAWLNFTGKRLDDLTADVALADVSLRFAKKLPQLDLESLQGRIKLAASEDEIQVSATKLSLATHEGLRIGPTQLGFRYWAGDEARLPQGSFSSGELDVRVLAQLAAYLPLPEQAAQKLAEAAPSGRIVDLSFNWQGREEKISSFDVKGRFKELELQPVGDLPGFKGVSAQLEGSDKSGQFSVTVKNGALMLPVALKEPIELSRMELAGSWGMEKSTLDAQQQAMTLRIRHGVASNPYLSADLSGLWQARAEGPGYLDVQASARRAKLDAVWRYIPHIATEYVANWLQDSLSGTGEDLRFQLTGELPQFPFHQSPGVFKLECKLNDAKLATYAPAWPGANAIQGSFLLDRQRITILADKARYQNALLREVKVEIPDLMDLGKQVLTVDGLASGATSDFLHYLNASPLTEIAGSFTRDLRAQGNGNLDLHIQIPLHDPLTTRVQGQYKFSGNTLRLIPALPEFSEAGGVLGFTEKGLSLPSAEAVFLGKRVRATGLTEADGSLRFDAQGPITAAGLQKLVPNPMWRHLAGETSAQAQIRVHHKQVEVSVRSTLQGIRSALPAPLRKDAAEAWPLLFSVKADSPVASTDTRLNWRVKLDQRLEVGWLEQCGDKHCLPSRGVVAVGDEANLPAQGWRVSGVFAELDADRWQPHILEFLSGLGVNESAPGVPLAVATRVGHLLAAGHQFRDVSGRAFRREGQWTLRLDGPDLAGDLNWSESGNGRLRARLSQLSLQPVDEALETSVNASPGTQPVAENASSQPLPALDIEAEHFQLRSFDLGKLSLQAVNEEKNWLLRNISVSAPDMKITGSGSWQRSRGTQLDFKLHSTDLGSMLGRFGQANVVRRGTVDFEGNLAWKGLPTVLHYPSMIGQLKLKASDGQFRKLEPGAGRLIGILSLQSLPRRMFLDFRDVFSEGFAFDSISGDMRIDAGVLHTGDLQVRGPAAKVFITGSTDLAHEMHDLNLRVQPTLSETVAVGVLVGQAAVGILNPVVGAAVYLGQKLLQDPVEKIFSYDYTVTGRWAEPDVEKKGSRPSASPASAPAASGSAP